MANEELIHNAYKMLVDALPKEMTPEGRVLIDNAFLLAKEAHAPQRRDTGLPYILHPLAVALIVVKEMRQRDPAIIAAALLHDVVEDTPYTIHEIRDRFGDDVAFLVQAVTKPNKKQVDNFQHILSSVKCDVRVLLLKLSDRLHNMRTLSGLSEQKQWKISSETQYFFAPLAGRLGLYLVKSELENLAFQFLNPIEYKRIENLLEDDKQRTSMAVNKFMDECLHYIGGQMGGPLGWSIRYRKPYSVWREMQERHCDFYHVPFKHYIRVSYNLWDVDDTFNYQTSWHLTDEDVIMRIYSLLSAKFRERTGSFVNYIAQPKANGYKSIHFQLLNPYGGIEEFHVASETMREQSYYGCILDSEEQWMGRLKAVLEELAEDPESLMPGIHDSLYNEDVVVFTPQSETIVLPKNATALDFAYNVHSRIGEHAKYARINGRLAPIRAKLHRGDCVEIFTDDKIHPTEDWMDYVVSYRAKKSIRNWLNHRPQSTYKLCPHCSPMPGGEIIGFKDNDGRVTLHNRGCQEAIRMATEKGNTIVVVDDFKADPDVLYPVSVFIFGIDRYHLLQDILDCIVEEHHLSMTSLNTHTEDHIVHCNIGFAVHSAIELRETIASISAIQGVEEVNIVEIEMLFEQ